MEWNEIYIIEYIMEKNLKKNIYIYILYIYINQINYTLI